MSGQTLNELIATVFMRASDPPPAPAPQQFDPRAPESASSSAAASPDPAEQDLSLLGRAQQICDSIGVISPNDALRDISTSSLRTLFLPSLQAHLHSAVRTGIDHAARKQRLVQSQNAAAKFLNRVMPLGVVPPTTKQLLACSWSSISPDELASIGLDPIGGSEASRGTTPHAREVKIAMFKLEHALKANLEHFRNAYHAKKKLVGVKTPADVFYDLLLFPQQWQNLGRTGGRDEEDEENQDEEDQDDMRNETSTSTAPGGIASIRQYLLALINLHVLRSAQLITSASQELQLLRSMPPPPPPSAEPSTETAEWRLDRPPSSLPTSGPLMAPSGKVLRPFTITNKTRAEQASEVFRPGYRLPTMSIDEYLQEEQRRGNIIQGGGQASYDAPTSTEKRERRMEQDGTLDAEQAEEEQRVKDITWDEFTENNPKGAGNTMNRG